MAKKKKKVVKSRDIFMEAIIKRNGGLARVHENKKKRLPRKEKYKDKGDE